MRFFNKRLFLFCLFTCTCYLNFAYAANVKVENLSLDITEVRGVKITAKDRYGRILPSKTRTINGLRFNGSNSFSLPSGSILFGMTYSINGKVEDISSIKEFKKFLLRPNAGNEIQLGYTVIGENGLNIIKRAYIDHPLSSHFARKAKEKRKKNFLTSFEWRARKTLRQMRFKEFKALVRTKLPESATVNDIKALLKKVLADERAVFGRNPKIVSMMIAHAEYLSRHCKYASINYSVRNQLLNIFDGKVRSNIDEARSQENLRQRNRDTSAACSLVYTAFAEKGKYIPDLILWDYAQAASDRKKINRTIELFTGRAPARPWLPNF